MEKNDSIRWEISKSWWRHLCLSLSVGHWCWKMINHDEATCVFLEMWAIEVERGFHDIIHLLICHILILSQLHYISYVIHSYWSFIFIFHHKKNKQKTKYTKQRDGGDATKTPSSHSFWMWLSCLMMFSDALSSWVATLLMLSFSLSISCPWNSTELVICLFNDSRSDFELILSN